MKSGRTLLVLSIVTRLTVVVLLCALALLTEYLNLKTAYNHPRLVELSSGKTARVMYEFADGIFSHFEEPMQRAQTNGGMTWSIRIMGVPFTDPVAALSVLAKDHRLGTGFALGLILPLGLALTFGRVFCSYICPASLLFFTIARVRRLLERYLYFPQISLNRGFAWGVMIGGLGAAVWLGHGLWSLLLPYFAIGQTIFHGIAMGTLSVALGAVAVFAALDLFLGRQFTCRHVCPTGRLLGFIGRRSVVAIKRQADDCVAGCNSCADVCPMAVSPRLDQTVDCSLCGECLVICPTRCLSIGRRNGSGKDLLVSPARTREVPGESILEGGSGAAISAADQGTCHGSEASTAECGGKCGGCSGKSKVSKGLLLVVFGAVLALAGPASAHHFKGLPHYNYFENYPQIPEEEFLGQQGKYEFSLVVYDFQGIDRAEVEQPEHVRLFLVVFNLLDNQIYQGAATLEVLNRGLVEHSVRQESAELENLYSLRRKLPDTGRYSLRITLHDEGDLQCVIPFLLSTQKIHWGKWIGLGLVLFLTVAAVGARKARISRDRRATHGKAPSARRERAPSAGRPPGNSPAGAGPSESGSFREPPTEALQSSRRSREGGE